MKALYYNQQDTPNSTNDRTYLPNYYRIMNYRNDNEVIPNWKELKTLDMQEQQHRMKVPKQISSPNEVLQSDSDEDASATTTIATKRPIDQLAIESTSTQQIMRTERPIPTAPTPMEEQSTKEPTTLTTTATMASTTIIASKKTTLTTRATTTTAAVTKPNVGTTNVTSLAFDRKKLLGSGNSINSPKNTQRSNAFWGRWQAWTSCSRSCGGGVMSQSRSCLSR